VGLDEEVAFETAWRQTRDDEHLGIEDIAAPEKRPLPDTSPT